MHEDAPEAIVGAVLSFLNAAAMELHGREPGGKATAPREFV
jgi:hypothetical protein